MEIASDSDDSGGENFDPPANDGRIERFNTQYDRYFGRSRTQGNIPHSDGEYRPSRAANFIPLRCGANSTAPITAQELDRANMRSPLNEARLGSEAARRPEPANQQAPG